MKFVYLYFLTVPVLFAIDMVWLGAVAKNYYFKELGHLMTDKINWPAAIIFYLLYIVGIIYLAVLPGAKNGDLGLTLINAAVFGFLAYATYDLTNLATLKNWPLSLVFVDIIWGTILTTMVAFVSFNIYKWIS